MSLLTRALSHNPKFRKTKVVTDEQKELALAYLNGEITTGQVAHALGASTGGGWSRLAGYVMKMALNGELVPSSTINSKFKRGTTVMKK